MLLSEFGWSLYKVMTGFFALLAIRVFSLLGPDCLGLFGQVLNEAPDSKVLLSVLFD